MFDTKVAVHFQDERQLKKRARVLATGFVAAGLSVLLASLSIVTAEGGPRRTSEENHPAEVAMSSDSDTTNGDDAGGQVPPNAANPAYISVVVKEGQKPPNTRG